MNEIVLISIILSVSVITFIWAIRSMRRRNKIHPITSMV